MATYTCPTCAAVLSTGRDADVRCVRCGTALTSSTAPAPPAPKRRATRRK